MENGREYRGNYWPTMCPNGILYFSTNFLENLLKKIADDRASQQKKESIISVHIANSIETKKKIII